MKMVELGTYRRGAIVSLLGLALTSSCFPEPPTTITGSCVVEPNLDCRATGSARDATTNAPIPQEAGLVGYRCTGTSRPDLEATVIEGIPRGILCADRPGEAAGAAGAAGSPDDGTASYCCTEETVDCAYDPAGDCDPSSFGVQCRGTNRPESLNANLYCSNGTREGTVVSYCCTGAPEDPPCLQSDALGCSERMLGFLCDAGSLPLGENLGPNKSRADYFHPTCSMPEPAPNPRLEMFCCFMPAPVPAGGTCVNDTRVPNCAPRRFGFACYGPDRPEENNLPVRCAEPAFEGFSAEGYPATLYCCDFEDDVSGAAGAAATN